MTRLRQRMIDDMRVRNLAPNTQRADLQQVSAFAKHFGRSPTELVAHVRRLARRRGARRARASLPPVRDTRQGGLF